jgi:prolyl-tRNA synthetase
MKDAYSFDQDEAGAQHNYQQMYDAYCRIFSRTGLKFRPVEADTGLIGGISSHEFMVLANTGEELIVFDPDSQYAANVERAEVVPPSFSNGGELKPLEKVSTPKAKSVEDLCALLKIEASLVVKTLLYQTDDNEITAVLIRGDHQANEIKIKRFLGLHDLTLASPELVAKVTAAPIGFVGPVGLSRVRILADNAIRALTNFIVGGNEPDVHVTNVNSPRDFAVQDWGDFRQAQAGDPSPKSGSPLQTLRGIEVGHVFMLGTKYSEMMGATYLDADGQTHPAIMGCYGIGIGRTAAAAVEQNHDEKGICWPMPIAPFQAQILPVTTSEAVRQASEHLYNELIQQNIEVLLDDRNERGGVKFNDADMIGTPYHIIIGDKGLANNTIEIKDRKTGEKVLLPPNQAANWIKDAVTQQLKMEG